MVSNRTSVASHGSDRYEHMLATFVRIVHTSQAYDSDAAHPPLYLTPAVHAATGAQTTPARLRELDDVLDRHNALVIADDTLADLTFTEQTTSLAQLCAVADVVTVGSLSKSVWGGLRFGWLRADAAPCRKIVALHPKRPRDLRHRPARRAPSPRAARRAA